MRAIRKDLATRLELQISQETKVRIIRSIAMLMFQHIHHSQYFTSFFFYLLFHLFFLLSRKLYALLSILFSWIDHLL